MASAQQPAVSKGASLAAISGLQRRLLVMLLVPLGLLALVSAWFDYRSAGSAAVQQDQQLLRLVPLLADSVLAPGKRPGEPPVVLLAPPVDQFLNERGDDAAFCIIGLDGTVLLGEAWLAMPVPNTREPELHSELENGVTYRIVAQRALTGAGELLLVLADGSDARQQWVQALVLKVLLPNIVLTIAAAFAVSWAVRQALRPLIELKEAVERRSPRDLDGIDSEASPEEVRPLVESLNRLFALVNTQAESQRRFVADAAHQLRTPIAGLQAQVEAWAQAANAGTAGGAVTLRAEQINKLRSATRRTSQLANQLLTLSRADAQTMALQPTQLVDLKELCEVVLNMHLDAAGAKQIDLGLEAEPAQVSGHEWLLREALSNLVDNAVKYTPRGGVVTIRCGRRPNAGMAPFLEVEDDGPGIAPEARALVLERFYRLPGTAGEGSGLGLAIADEIAQTHRIRIELAAGSGGRGLRAGMTFPAA